MILGVGIDIIETKHLELLLQQGGERFKNEMFHPKEQEYCEQYRLNLERYAGRYASKRAIQKALGLTEVSDWTKICILPNPQGGPPQVHLFGALKEQMCSYPNFQLLLSISHIHSHASAFALAESNPL